MLKRTLALVGGLLLACTLSLPASAVPAAPVAPEHNIQNPVIYDNWALLDCSLTRPNGYVYIDYAWPYSMAPGVVVYNCAGHQHYDIGGNQGCWHYKWQAAAYSNGTLVGGNQDGPNGNLCQT